MTICTNDNPNRDANQHPDIKYIDDEYNGLAGGGDYEIWKCPNCGKRRYIELPD